MSYKIMRLYEKIVQTKDSLCIGKYTIIDGYEYETYKYDDAVAQKKISTATLRNLKILKGCGDVTFDKVYRVDRSQGRGAMSTYISGTIDNNDFIWARIETSNRASGQTNIYFDTYKQQGSIFLDNNYTPEVTISEGLYKVNNEYRQEIVYYKDVALTIKHRTQGPAHIRFDSKGNILEELWYSNNERHCMIGPAYIDYKIPHKKWIIDGVELFSTWAKDGIHRDLDDL